MEVQSVLRCSHCNSTDIEYSEAAGHSACVECGTLVEEDALVSTVEFQESGDRSHVVGTFVSASMSSKPYSSSIRSRGRYGLPRDSRETTLQSARKVIQQVATGMKLAVHYVDRAQRLYEAALQKNFLYGRRQIHVVAVMLYTICRQEASPYLLIDFSDILQINVYRLGQTFLQYIRLANMTIPLIDPSLFIHRFARKLNLGENEIPVTTTAMRTVSRFKKDWIAIGRRPDGVCACAMLLACRAHGFERNVTDMARLFRVSTDTINKRMADFKATPTAQLTLAEFHGQSNTDNGPSNIEELEAFDPPSFRRKIMARESEEKELKEAQEYLSARNANPSSSNVIVPPTTTIVNSRQSHPRPMTLQEQNKTLARRSLYGELYVGLVDPDVDTNDLDETARERQLALMAEAQEVVTGRRQDGRIVDVGGWGHESAIRISQNITQWDVDTDHLKGTQIDDAVTAVMADMEADRLRYMNQTANSQANVMTTQSNMSTNSNTVTLDTMTADPTATSSGSDTINGIGGITMIDRNGVMDLSKKDDNDDYESNHNDDENNEPLMDEDELESFMMTEQEREKKKSIWEKIYRPFLDDREKKRVQREEERLRKQHERAAAKKDGVRAYNRGASRSRSGNKKNVRGKDADGAADDAPRKISKKVNYAALGDNHAVDLTTKASSSNISSSSDVARPINPLVATTSVTAPVAMAVVAPPGTRANIPL